MIFSEVINKLFFEERRLSSGGDNVSFEDLAFTVDKGKGKSKKNVIC